MLSVFSARAPFNNLLRAFRARVFARPPATRDPTRFNHHSDKLSEVAGFGLITGLLVWQSEIMPWFKPGGLEINKITILPGLKKNLTEKNINSGVTRSKCAIFSAINAAAAPH